MVGGIFGLEEAGEVLDKLLSGGKEDNPFQMDLNSLSISWDQLTGMKKR